ncbi:MAG: FAD:protein FMN transferase [Bacteroidota bacterium]
MYHCNMNKKALLAFGIGLLVAFFLFTYLRKGTPRMQHISGLSMGTITYNVKYIGLPQEGLDVLIDDELKAFNQSLSTYIPDSEISTLNETGELTYSSSYFFPVMKMSEEIYEKTGGTFDPTIGPLVQAWGFGPDKRIPNLDSSQVDSLRLIVGFEKVTFDSMSATVPPNGQIDFSAIAKGYAVDLVGELLEENGIQDYLVEIGGEVRCRGINEEKKSWSLGIEDPMVDSGEQELLAIVRLRNKSLATSGNYRNYYEKDGKTYAHIIDPRTGYNAEHNLLSASVFAEDCMTADAFATAFMVLGTKDSKQIIAANDIEAILIYQNEKGELKSYISEGIEPFVELNKAK